MGKAEVSPSLPLLKRRRMASYLHPALQQMCCGAASLPSTCTQQAAPSRTPNTGLPLRRMESQEEADGRCFHLPKVGRHLFWSPCPLAPEKEWGENQPSTQCLVSKYPGTVSVWVEKN